MRRKFVPSVVKLLLAESLIGLGQSQSNCQVMNWSYSPTWGNPCYFKHDALEVSAPLLLKFDPIPYCLSDTSLPTIQQTCDDSKNCASLPTPWKFYGYKALNKCGGLTTPDLDQSGASTYDSISDTYSFQIKASSSNKPIGPTSFSLCVEPQNITQYANSTGYLSNPNWITCTYEIVCGPKSTSSSLQSEFASSFSNGEYVFNLSHRESTIVPRQAEYIASKFQVTNTNCPGNLLTIQPATGYTVNNYTHNGVVTYLESTSGSSSVTLRLPVSTTDLIFYQTFAIKFDAIGGYSKVVEPIKVRSTNCTNLGTDDLIDYPTKKTPVNEGYTDYNYTIFYNGAYNMMLPMWNTDTSLDWVKNECNMQIESNIQTCNFSPFNSDTFWKSLYSKTSNVKIESISQSCTEASRGVCYKISLPQTQGLFTNIAFQLELKGTNNLNLAACISVKLINCQYATWAIPIDSDLETLPGKDLVIASSKISNYTYSITNYLGTINNPNYCPTTLTIQPIFGGTSADYTYNGFTPEIISASQVSNNVLLNIPLDISSLCDQKIKFRVKARCGNPAGTQWSVDFWTKFTPDIWINIVAGCLGFTSGPTIVKPILTQFMGLQTIHSDLATLFSSTITNCPNTFEILKSQNPDVQSANVTMTGSGPFDAQVDTNNIDTGYVMNTTFNIWVKANGDCSYVAYQQLTIQVQPNCALYAITVLKTPRYEMFRYIDNQQNINLPLEDLFASSEPVLCPIQAFSLLNDWTTQTVYSGTDFTYDQATKTIIINNWLPNSYDLTVKARITTDWTVQEHLDIRITIPCLQTVQKLQTGVPSYFTFETATSTNYNVVLTSSLFNSTAYHCPYTRNVFADVSLQTLSVAPNATLSSTIPQYVIIDRMVLVGYDYTYFSVWVKSENGGTPVSQEIRIRINVDCNIKTVSVLQPPTYQIVKQIDNPSVINIPSLNLFESSNSQLCPITYYQLYSTYPSTPYAGSDLSINNSTGIITINSWVPGYFPLILYARLWGYNPLNTLAINISIPCLNSVQTTQSSPPQLSEVEGRGLKLLIDVTSLFTQSSQFCSMTYQVYQDSGLTALSSNVTLSASSILQIDTSAYLQTTYAWTQFSVWVKATNGPNSGSQEVKITLTPNCDLKYVKSLVWSNDFTLIKSVNDTLQTSNFFISSLPGYCDIDTYSLHNNDPPANSSYTGLAMNINSATGVVTVTNMTEGIYIVNVKASKQLFIPANFSLITIHVVCFDDINFKDNLTSQYKTVMSRGIVSLQDVTSLFTTPDSNWCQIASYALVSKVGTAATADVLSKNTTLNGTWLQIDTNNVDQTYNWKLFSVWVRANTTRSAVAYKQVQIQIELNCDIYGIHVNDSASEVYFLDYDNFTQSLDAIKLAWFWVDPNQFNCQVADLQYTLHNNDQNLSPYFNPNVQLKDQYLSVNNSMPSTYQFFVRASFANFTKRAEKLITINMLCRNKVIKAQNKTLEFTVVDNPQTVTVSLIAIKNLFNMSLPNCPFVDQSVLSENQPQEIKSLNVSINENYEVTALVNLDPYDSSTYAVWVKASCSRGAFDYQKILINYKINEVVNFSSPIQKSHEIAVSYNENSILNDSSVYVYVSPKITADPRKKLSLQINGISSSAIQTSFSDLEKSFKLMVFRSAIMGNQTFTAQVQYKTDTSLQKQETFIVKLTILRASLIKVDQGALIAQKGMNTTSWKPSDTKQGNIQISNEENVLLSELFSKEVEPVTQQTPEFLLTVLNELGFQSLDSQSRLLIDKELQSKSKISFSTFKSVIVNLRTKESLGRSLPYLIPRISKVSNIGEVTIDFSSPILTKYINYTKIGPEVLELYIKPSNLQEGESETQGLNFTWNTERFNDTRLLIKMNFSDPIEISKATSLDSLVVNFKNWSSSIFIACKYGTSIHPNFTTISNSVPRQMPPSAENMIKAAEITKGAMQISLVALIPVAILFGKVMSKLALFYQSALLIFHTPLLSIVTPSNAVVLFSLINPAIVADIQKQLVGIFGYETQQPPTELGQFVSAGYDSFKLLENIGPIKSLFYVYAAKVLLVFAYSKYPSKLKKLEKYVVQFRSDINWGDALVILKQGYLELMVSGCITIFADYVMKNKQSQKAVSSTSRLLEEAQDTVDSRYSISLSNLPFGTIIIVICSILAPVLHIKLMTKAPAMLKNKLFKRKWGYLYEDIDVYRKIALGYNLLFYLRRIFYIYTVQFFTKDAGLQFVLLCYLNMFCQWYQAEVRPFTNRFMNNIELFNNCIVCFSFYSLVGCSEMIPDAQSQFNAGWVLIFLVVFGFTVNLYFVAKEVCQKLRLMWFKLQQTNKFYKKLKASWDSFIEKYFQKKQEIKEVQEESSDDDAKLIDVKTKPKDFLALKVNNVVVQHEEQIKPPAPVKAIEFDYKAYLNQPVRAPRIDLSYFPKVMIDYKGEDKIKVNYSKNLDDYDFTSALAIASETNSRQAQNPLIVVDEHLERYVDENLQLFHGHQMLEPVQEVNRQEAEEEVYLYLDDTPSVAQESPVIDEEEKQEEVYVYLDDTPSDAQKSSFRWENVQPRSQDDQDDDDELVWAETPGEVAPTSMMELQKPQQQELTNPYESKPVLQQINKQDRVYDKEIPHNVPQDQPYTQSQQSYIQEHLEYEEQEVPYQEEIKEDSDIIYIDEDSEDEEAVEQQEILEDSDIIYIDEETPTEDDHKNE